MTGGQFSQIDYILFVIVIVVSLGIGLYYAIKFRKVITTVDDYLLGGRNMGLIPVTCSLVATSISASSSVGSVTETYAYGSYIVIYAYGTIVMGIMLSQVFLPIFFDLKLTSVFKYFELRFNRRLRLLASGLYLLSGLFNLSLTAYIPALIFQQVTGVNVYGTVIFLSIVCAIYTAIGGFRAVIWTDVVQLLFIFGSMGTIIALGIASANGFWNVIDAANRGGRIILINYKVVNSRTSIWGQIFCTVILSTYQFGLNQTNIQRFMSLPNLRKMKMSVWLLVIIVSFFCAFLSPLLGIIVYSNYEACDPFTAKIISKIDHIVPYFIQEKAALFHGFNGIFIAGIFAASLSTMSSYLNAMSGIIYEDFISLKYPGLKVNTSERIIKGTVIILAVMQISMVFLIEKMGTILQISSQCISLSACTLLTLFILGVFIPKINIKGAQAAALASISCTLALIIGGLNAPREPTLPFRTDGCDMEQLEQLKAFNSTIDSFSKTVKHSASLSINFIYYPLIGTLVGLVVGYTVSHFTGGNVVEDQRLLAKFLRKKNIPRDIPGEEMKLRSLMSEKDQVF